MVLVTTGGLTPRSSGPRLAMLARPLTATVGRREYQGERTDRGDLAALLGVGNIEHVNLLRGFVGATTRFRPRVASAIRRLKRAGGVSWCDRELAASGCSRPTGGIDESNNRGARQIRMGYGSCIVLL